MENAEEIFHFLEEFSKRKTKTIPQELNDYLAYVARTGDPVYQWSLVKSLFKEKLLNVITDFYETSPGIDIPPYPNVDPFNYDIMKNSLLERLDSFTSAPFTVQRICELLTFPRKQYNRVDKFMRAIEKNILVVSTREPGIQRHVEPENGEPMEPIVNGSDNNSDYNVDVEMEDVSWKESEPQHNSEPQPGSSDSHISVDDLEARLQAKQNNPMSSQEKIDTQYESVTPPELNVSDSNDEQELETKDNELATITMTSTSKEEPSQESDKSESSANSEEVKSETESISPPLVIPEIKVDDAEMTERKLIEAAAAKLEPVSDSENSNPEPQEPLPASNVDVKDKQEDEPKPEPAPTSNSESAESNDSIDENGNPKIENDNVTVQDESSQSESVKEPEEEHPKILPDSSRVETEKPPQISIETDNYSISDVNSELPQMPPETPPNTKTEEVSETKETKPEPESNEDKKEENEVPSTDIVES